MKRKTMNVLLVLFFAMGLSGCGISQKEYDLQVSKYSEIESRYEELERKYNEQNAAIDKYNNIIDCMIKDDYEGAIKIIEEQRKTKLAETAGNIVDYIVEIELNDDNFYDYFECIKLKKYNSFGEEITDEVGFGLKSKLYDEGLILYDDKDLRVEMLRNDWADEDTLTSLLSLGNAISGSVSYDSFDLKFNRTVGGTVKFLQKEYVLKNIIVDDFENDLLLGEIHLLNGEVINRYYHQGYEY